MKTFQLDSEPNRLYFTNYNRIDEEALFQNVLATLERCKDIKIGRKQTGPSEDIYGCKVSGFPFTLVYDIDYGAYIQANTAKIIQKLKDILEMENNDVPEYNTTGQ